MSNKNSKRIFGEDAFIGSKIARAATSREKPLSVEDAILRTIRKRKREEKLSSYKLLNYQKLKANTSCNFTSDPDQFKSIEDCVKEIKKLKELIANLNLQIDYLEHENGELKDDYVTYDWFYELFTRKGWNLIYKEDISIEFKHPIRDYYIEFHSDTGCAYYNFVYGCIYGSTKEPNGLAFKNQLLYTLSKWENLE